MLYIKELTPTSWILKEVKTEKTLGVVSYKEGKFFLMGNNDGFANIANIAKYLEHEIEEQQEIKKKEIIKELNGFEIAPEHKELFEISKETIKNIEVSSYKIKEKGNLRYAAGWFGIIFPEIITKAQCPTTKKLQDNNFLGPYKSLLDLQFSIQQYINRLDI